MQHTDYKYSRSPLYCTKGCGGTESEILQMGAVLISFKAQGENFLFPLDCFLLISRYVAKEPHQSAEEVREVGEKRGEGGAIGIPRMYHPRFNDCQSLNLLAIFREKASICGVFYKKYARCHMRTKELRRGSLFLMTVTATVLSWPQSSLFLRLLLVVETLPNLH